MPTVLITGASRGLGLEFTRQYAADGWRVLACARTPDKATALNEVAEAGSDVHLFTLDVSDFVAVDRLAAELLEEKIDVLINNAGVFGPKISEDNDLRQSFRHIDYGIWQQVLLTNTLAPIKMAEAFITQIEAGAQKKIVTISSVMGSIAQAAGGYYAYGSSKAAVNKAMAALARDLEASGITVAVFCPGWVKTDIGGPMASLEPHQSIADLRGLIAGLTLEQTGSFIRHNGDVLPW